MGKAFRGTYTIDEIDEALFSRGIPAITRTYVTTMDGDVIELEYACFRPGKYFEADGPACLVFSVLWMWSDRVESRYQIVMEGRRRLLSGIIHEYERRV